MQSGFLLRRLGHSQNGSNILNLIFYARVPQQFRNKLPKPDTHTKNEKLKYHSCFFFDAPIETTQYFLCTGTIEMNSLLIVMEITLQLFSSRTCMITITTLSDRFH